MPKRTDLHSILILGSGPIVIGQGCEFDYSGTQACRALREEGYRIVLINSNPATIMTDPQFADATYVEPISVETVRKVLQREKDQGTPIDAVLPTLGGQTGLNVGMACHDEGVFDAFGVEMIGAKRDAIFKGEDRQAFKDLMLEIGLDVPISRTVHDMEAAREALKETGLPAIIRPAFTLGGTGGGIAYTEEEFEDIAAGGLDASPTTEILVEQSVLGWKEFELEVIRDHADNAIVVCGIENIDPMGVHTGDSITVAPVQTLTDKEYQRMRDAALKVIRAVGVETGGSNIQFGVNPENGHQVVIEMNPRVSRSSALASKATGFPIAKIAAKLAVGYTLDELPNDITRKTPACFEPTIDYVVVKMPRWTFEKFPEADETLTTQMKSVGEAMAIGRTFKEALQKAIRSMEVGRAGLGLDKHDASLPANGLEYPIPADKLDRKLRVPSQGRLYYVRYALKQGLSVEQVHERTKIDPWFLREIEELVTFETFHGEETEEAGKWAAIGDIFTRSKLLGYSDIQTGVMVPTKEGVQAPELARGFREAFAPPVVYKLVDTCAAEFEAATPYYYSGYEEPFVQDGALVVDDEIRVSDKPKVVIIGGGPNRIGQGIEFDYCCVQAAFAARELGFESVMINSNPETVSTDYDTSDLLFFEPLTHEDVLNVIERLNGKPLGEAGGYVDGVVVQFGGQTPLNLAKGLEEAGVPILGTSVDAIHAAGSREQFRDLLKELGLRQPANGIARSVDEAKSIANDVGYPVLVRPSFVLGGRAMETVYDEAALDRYMTNALAAAGLTGIADSPILIDKFLDRATEVDVDCVADFSVGGEDGGTAVVAGVMEHIEEAGIHSGDSACVLPPYSLSPQVVDELKRQTRLLAERLKVTGLMNVQYAVRDGEVFVIEVNPRASRTVPFVGKTTGTPWARIAAKVMMGQTLAEQGITGDPAPLPHVAVKEAVFPFSKFPGCDIILGPEMKSTGEVMGLDDTFPIAFAKSQLAAGSTIPTGGTLFVSVNDADKPRAVPIVKRFADLGFKLLSTGGTHAALAEAGIESTLIHKIAEQASPNLRDYVEKKDVQLILNTPTRKGSGTDEAKIRAMAFRGRVPIVTTLTAADAWAKAIEALKQGDWGVKPLQAYHA